MKRALVVHSMLITISANVAFGAEPFIHFGGNAIRGRDWRAGELRTTLATSVRSVAFESHGRKHAGNAVPLLAVLKASGLDVTLKMDPHADPKSKNIPLRLTVLVRGSDGYLVAFSVAELLPEIGNHAAWLLLDEDGAALPDQSAPVELIVPDDAKPGRWVRGVAEVQVDAPSPTR